jgi:hypothetical protein
VKWSAAFLSDAESITFALALGAVVGGRAGWMDGGREEAGKVRREREGVEGEGRRESDREGGSEGGGRECV